MQVTLFRLYRFRIKIEYINYSKRTIASLESIIINQWHFNSLCPRTWKYCCRFPRSHSTLQAIVVPFYGAQMSNGIDKWEHHLCIVFDHKENGIIFLTFRRNNRVIVKYTFKPTKEKPTTKSLFDALCAHYGDFISIII